MNLETVVRRAVRPKPGSARQSPRGAGMIDPTATMPLTARDVRDRLCGVIDPEIGIGIVDLGLVYGVDLDDDAITVTMTMTTPACPLGAYLEQAVEQALADIAGHRLIVVALVFDPPWNPEMISAQGRALLGWGS